MLRKFSALYRERERERESINNSSLSSLNYRENRKCFFCLPFGKAAKNIFSPTDRGGTDTPRQPPGLASPAPGGRSSVRAVKPLRMPKPGLPAGRENGHREPAPVGYSVGCRAPSRRAAAGITANRSRARTDFCGIYKKGDGWVKSHFSEPPTLAIGRAALASPALIETKAAPPSRSESSRQTGPLT